MQLNNKWFLTYKLFNSTFTGLSVGILFTIYNPLDPEIYSLGGIILASAMLILAKFYEKLLNIKSFYLISVLVFIVRRSHIPIQFVPIILLSHHILFSMQEKHSNIC